jgi:transcriptional regulator with XRE-family HTH domain
MKDRIIQIIEKEGLTAGKFAQLIGTQPSVISHILNGRNKPSMEIIQKILSTFREINPDWLILGVGGMSRSTQTAQTTLFGDMQQTESSMSKEINKPKTSQRISLKEVESFQNQKDDFLKNEKRIKKITVYFSDMTFEDFIPSDTAL